jgi:hypothetical protein
MESERKAASRNARLLSETLFKRLYVQHRNIAEEALNPPFGLRASNVTGSESVSTGGDRGIRTPDLCDANASS